ncbi:MAG: OmpA family protein [Myxococcota bacterium]
MTRRLVLSSVCVLFTILTGVALAEDAPRSFPITDGRLELPGPVTFETGTATLSKDSAGVVEYIGAFLAEKSAITLLRIEGHVDGADDPQALSERRAMAVVRALVARGVDCKRLLPVGFGQHKPVAPRDTPEGRSRNTRVEAAPAMLRGRAIGGMPVDGGGQTAGDPCK